METNIELKLNRAGWCDCRIEVGNQNIQFTGSFLSNPIKGLLSATSFLLLGGLRAQCIFRNPLGDYLVILKRLDDRVSVQVMKLVDRFVSNANVDGEMLFSADVAVFDFAEALYASGTSLVADMNKQQFKEIWPDDDFPHFELYRLYSILKSRTHENGGSQMSTEEISSLNSDKSKALG